ncbi:hypothetical protein [Streptomyces atroolivaceus]|uniref:Uncharacterized protein n=1 Tax=Streptomyces atroolivaceus TaxID=66869 RepID=A0ABV9VFS5_STRAZ|nr:hypothetical protein [Streptomyces atroolivaceus]
MRTAKAGTTSLFAGDGTALLIKALHDFGGKDPATDMADSEEKQL